MPIGRPRKTADRLRQSHGTLGALTCEFLFLCSGYCNYDEGYSPRFAGFGGFRQAIIHPQHWPEDLDYDAKNIVVIGSGATAVTLVPALARLGRHVTMPALTHLHRVAADRDGIAEAQPLAAGDYGSPRYGGRTMLPGGRVQRLPEVATACGRCS